MRSLLLVLLSFLSLFTARAADDFQNDSRTYLRFDAGYAIQDAFRVSFGANDGMIRTKNGERGDFVYGYRLNRWLALEAEAGLVHTRLIDLGRHDYYQVPLLANLAWSYPGEKLRPFLSLGAGGVGLIAVPRENSQTDKTITACGQFATGIHYRLTKRFEAGLGYKLLLVAPATLDYAHLSSSQTHTFFASLRYNF